MSQSIFPFSPGDTRLSCQRLLTSLLGILDSRGNSFIRTHFGAEAVKILHRSVLNNPHYLQRITVQDAREGGEGQWIRLLKISFQLFQSKKPPHGLDPLLLCSFLHDLLVQCDAHTSLPRSLLLNKFPFFTNLIGSTEINSSSTDTQKQLLKTIVTFMRLVN